MKLLLIAVAAIAIVLSVEKAYGIGIPSQVTILAGSSEPNTNHFEPKTLTIEKGDTVKWTNNDSGLHTVTSGKPTGVESGIKFDSSYLQSGESWTHTFKKTGNFDYYCTLHPYVTAKIIVE